ncbi:MAG: hypothetical protein JNJ57_05205 [Saprospiraceae bacterium]|nr:hypothetical protein [Saprospiraceae bacterium]
MKEACFSALFVSLLGLLSGTVAAQKFLPFSVKADALGFSSNLKKFNAALEWRKNGRTAFELSFSHEERGSIPDWGFNGDWESEFAMRRTYEIQWGSTSPYNDSGWEYFGTGRPLPEQETNGLSLSVSKLQLGLRQYYPAGWKGCQWFVQPGLMGSLYKDFRVISDETLVYDDITESWRIGAFSAETQVVAQTKYFFQERKMRLEKYVLFGPTLSIGMAIQVFNCIRIEPLVQVGFNIGNLPDEDYPELREQIKVYEGRFKINIGYAFGL